MLPSGRNPLGMTHRFTHDKLILLRKKIHCKIDSFQVASYRCDIPRLACTYRQADGIVVPHQLLSGYILPNLGIGSEEDPLLHKLIQPSVDHLLVEFEVGYAIPEQATRTPILFEN